MHELSIAQNILKVVAASVKNKRNTKIKKIFITLGVLSGVEKESLLFSFNLIPKSLIFKNTKLVINENELTIYCSKCKEETIIKNGYILKCSICGNLTSEVIKGKELTVDKIEI